MFKMHNIIIPILKKETYYGKAKQFFVSLHPIFYNLQCWQLSRLLHTDLVLIVLILILESRFPPLRKHIHLLIVKRLYLCNEWTPCVVWLVIVHDLVEYRHTDDVTGKLFSLFCPTAHSFKNVCETISNWASKALKKVCQKLLKLRLKVTLRKS